MGHNIRVLHVIHWPKSGIVSVVKSIIERMPQDEVSSHVAFFEADVDTLGSFQDACATCADLGLRRSQLFAVMRYRDVIRSVEPQVLHAHSLQPLLWGASIVKRTTKILSTVHNEYPYFSGNEFRSKVKRFAHAGLVRWGGVKTVAVSYGVRDAVMRLGVSSESCLVIENGVSINGEMSGNAERWRAREQIGLNKGAIIAVTVGRLDHQKGFDTLLRAFSIVASEEPRAMLVFVGDGEEKDMLHNLSRTLGIDDRVIFAGYIPYPEPYYRAADIYVNSSRFEGFAVSVLEAMGCSLPVVATRAGAAEEVIGDGETGYLVEVGDERGLAAAMRRLMSNPDAAREMGKAAHERVKERWGIERTAEAYLGLYRELSMSA